MLRGTRDHGLLIGTRADCGSVRPATLGARTTGSAARRREGAAARVRTLLLASAHVPVCPVTGGRARVRRRGTSGAPTALSTSPLLAAMEPPVDEGQGAETGTRWVHSIPEGQCRATAAEGTGTSPSRPCPLRCGTWPWRPRSFLGFNGRSRGRVGQGVRRRAHGQYARLVSGRSNCAHHNTRRGLCAPPLTAVRHYPACRRSQAEAWWRRGAGMPGNRPRVHRAATTRPFARASALHGSLLRCACGDARPPTGRAAGPHGVLRVGVLGSLLRAVPVEHGVLDELRELYQRVVPGAPSRPHSGGRRRQRSPSWPRPAAPGGSRYPHRAPGRPCGSGRTRTRRGAGSRGAGAGRLSGGPHVTGRRHATQVPGSADAHRCPAQVVPGSSRFGAWCRRNSCS